MGITWEFVKNGESQAPDLLTHNLYFNQISKLVPIPIKAEKHCSKENSHRRNAD